MLILSHPTGNAYTRHTALALWEAELLQEFWTAISWNPDSAAARFLPGKLQRQFARRTYLPQIREKAHLHPWREVGRLLAPTLGLRGLTRHESGYFSIDAVFRSLDRRVAKRLSQVEGIRGVWAHEDGACDTFRSARQRGMKCFYDLPIGHWRAGHAIYGEEKEREPQWAATLTGMLDSPEKLARKDEELRLADAVFVASSFTRSTLQGVPELTAPVYTAPYGAPSPSEAPPAQKSGSSRLRVIFVGSLSQRKGLSYLLDAVQMLRDHVELTLIGLKTGAECAPLEAALREHRWIGSLPHAEILREMQQHDVLVFPSLFEGFGLVITEAMSQGLPVITTSHTAGPDVISDEQDGFIVPVRSAQAIAQKLELLITQPEVLHAMKMAAWQKAATCSWETFRSTQARAVKEELQK
ncbi:MAG: glycosyltransferase family 4 protein [Armatimonadetes bacterium]|nr:glycosyltransferase family 4 protein [Armatimonadota bacterium]